LIRAIGIHNVELVARMPFASGLKDQLLSIGRPVGFGILTSRSQLPQVVEMRLRADHGARGESGQAKISSHGLKPMIARVSNLEPLIGVNRVA
jgi:hypothetical protein